MSRFTNYQLKRLEAIFEELEYKIRYGRGQFNSGYCLLRDQKTIVINQFFDTSGKVEVLLEIMDQVPGERSEEHTSELQSRGHLVCRLLREKQNRSWDNEQRAEAAGPCRVL